MQETEISEAFFVPIKYFYEIDYGKNNGFFRYFNAKVFGRNCKIQKIVLNDNENYLLYGMTQRIFLRFLRLSEKDKIKFEEKVIFNSSNIDGLVGISFAIPVMFAPSFINQAVSQLPLKPV